MSTTRRPTLSLILACLLLFSLAPPALADTCDYQCQWWTYEGCGHYEYICEPEYYVWQSSEPDWCIYSPGDRVDVLRNPSNFHIYAWYVEPWQDSGANGTYYVVHNQYGCSILVFP